MRLTVPEFLLRMQGYKQRLEREVVAARSSAYMTAALMRADKFPDFDTFVSPPKWTRPTKADLAARIKAALD